MPEFPQKLFGWPLSLSRADDAVILEAARRQQAVVVTLDADFHYLLATTRATAPSVIRLRVEGLKADRLASLIAQAIAAASTELASGAVASVTEYRLRIRALPIGR